MPPDKQSNQRPVNAKRQICNCINFKYNIVFIPPTTDPFVFFINQPMLLISKILHQYQKALPRHLAQIVVLENGATICDIETTILKKKEEDT